LGREKKKKGVYTVNCISRVGKAGEKRELHNKILEGLLAEKIALFIVGKKARKNKGGNWVRSPCSRYKPETDGVGERIGRPCPVNQRKMVGTVSWSGDPKEVKGKRETEKGKLPSLGVGALGQKKNREETGNPEKQALTPFLTTSQRDQEETGTPMVLQSQSSNVGDKNEGRNLGSAEKDKSFHRRYLIGDKRADDSERMNRRVYL